MTLLALIALAQSIGLTSAIDDSADLYRHEHKEVSYRADELSSEAGRRRLARRLRAAAISVCSEGGPPSLLELKMRRQCVEEAMQLARLHVGMKTGVELK